MFNKKLFLIPLVLFILGISLLILSKHVDKDFSDYKIGDCLSYVFAANEFQPEKISELQYHIIQVGKEEYLVHTYLKGKATKSLTTINVLNKYFVNREDSNYRKVNCDFGDTK